MPADPLEIDVADLKRLSDLLLRHLEEVEGKRIKLDKDFFWAIAPAERFDVYREPTSFTVGQLTESWSNLRDLDESSALAYALVWLADILRTIGEEVVG